MPMIPRPPAEPVRNLSRCRSRPLPADGGCTDSTTDMSTARRPDTRYIFATAANKPGGENQMARITRRNFVQASGALALAPALATVTAQAQPPPPDIGNLRAEKDIVFGKGGDLGLTLDVYHPPQGVTPKRMAIIHLFGGGFFAGNKNA